MHNFLDTLALGAKKTIQSGYYRNIPPKNHTPTSLKQAIQNCKTNAVITEIKAASPSLGTIRSSINPAQIATAMQQGGAIGLSILTEPNHFNGSLQTLIQARNSVKLPILMKDIIVSTEQIDAAVALGADACLLMQALFDKGHCETELKEMISYAHNRGLEVLLETHTEAEYKTALQTDADLIGINNRNLDTLKIDLKTTQQILSAQGKQSYTIISESGIKSPGHLQFLRGCGADAFLVGSSIMLAKDIKSKVEELVNTI
ncbi:MAG: indole-3-glycerol-phosphate synthase [Methanocella sp.]|jgi:indole-3-glycerol phosphate synthase